MNKRIISVLTGTRAEYGILRPLLREIKDSDYLDLRVLVTGMHLLESHGNSYKDIEEDNFHLEKINMYLENGEDLSISLSRAITNFNNYFVKNRPEILVVFGDRLEPLAATLAASILNIPIAHISGGDKTDSGIIDESIRHSITRFSHLHFPETSNSAERLKKMGEEDWRIILAGALEIDAISQIEKVSKEFIFRKYNLDYNQPLIMCIQHSFNIEKDKAGDQIKETIAALNESNIQSLIIYPNNDEGSGLIINQLEKLDRSFIKIRKNIVHPDYINLLRNCTVLIGNSSSGIVEAPTFNVPVINIGKRNSGRENSGNVIFTNNSKEDILAALDKCINDESYINKIRKIKNVYGGGSSAKTIVKTLESAEINQTFLTKKITY